MQDQGKLHQVWLQNLQGNNKWQALMKNNSNQVKYQDYKNLYII